MSRHFDICQFILKYSRGIVKINNRTVVNVFGNNEKINVHIIITDNTFTERIKTSLNYNDVLPKQYGRLIDLAEAAVYNEIINNCKDSLFKAILNPSYSWT